MNILAKVENGIVVATAMMDPERAAIMPDAATWFPCAPEVVAGWTQSADGSFVAPPPPPAPPLPEIADAKAGVIFLAKAQAAVRINSQWPDYAQRSAALGLYDGLDPKDPFFPANMKAGIMAIIDAEHKAEAEINALSDAASILSYKVVLP